LSPLCAAALILNPAYRTRYIEGQWPKKYVKSTLKTVSELWEKYRDQPIEIQPSIPRFSYDKAKEPKELDEFDQLVEDMCTATRPKSADEYEDYNSQDSFKLPKNMIALEWWCQDAQTTRWPRLSRMAIEILSIPPMSDEPERVFSGARRTVSWDRGQIEVDTIECRECLKHWKNSGILNLIIEETDLEVELLD
jgi:hypothetical protein